MKRIAITIAIAVCAVFCANAQKNSISVEALGGVGLDLVNYNAGANFVFAHEFNELFSLGAGIGGSYVDGEYSHTTTKSVQPNGKESISESECAHSEILVPLFVRGKYVYTGMDLSKSFRLNPYFAVDAGYSFNVSSEVPQTVKESDFRKSANGLFFTPQLGLDADRFFFSVGVEVQSRKHIDEYLKQTVSGLDITSSSYGSTILIRNVDDKNSFSQTLVFRVGVKF